MSVREHALDREGARIRGDVLDVSEMPSFAFGNRGVMWWGTMSVVLIEGTVFALVVMAYFYLRSQSDQPWPLSSHPPELLWGTLNTLIMIASAWPNHWTKKQAEALDLPKVRTGMVICIVFAVAFLGVRILEFRTLNVGWDSNAYGSLVWVLLGLHTLHLITDFIDTAVLAVLMHTEPLEGRRFVDVAENGLYWYFVVFAWLPIYGVIYWAPRL